MSFQYPVEILVLVTNFIKTAINETRKSQGLDDMSSSEMLKKIREKANCQYGLKFFVKVMNEGFSGGEKKEMKSFKWQ